MRHPHTGSDAREAALLARVYEEYVELPGLQLTLAQASRLWHVDPTVARSALEELVQASFLRKKGDCYVRTDCERICA
jgi:hypothetical protein